MKLSNEGSSSEDESDAAIDDYFNRSSTNKHKKPTGKSVKK